MCGCEELRGIWLVRARNSRILLLQAAVWFRGKGLGERWEFMVVFCGVCGAVTSATDGPCSRREDRYEEVINEMRGQSVKGTQPLEQVMNELRGQSVEGTHPWNVHGVTTQ